jgi:large subunit ribosomal protein L25
MEAFELKTNTRVVLGKKTRLLRRQGLTPSHLFGHDIKSQSLQCSTAELEHIVAKAGTTRLIGLRIDDIKKPHMVFIREIQKDPISGQIIHIDFYQVKMTEKMTANIPLILTGQAPALKGKGRILAQPLTHLSVECLPEKLPPYVKVDISSLEEMDDAIYVKDILLDPEVTIVSDPEQLVAKVSEVAAAKIDEEEEAAAAAAAAEEEEGAEVEGEAIEEGAEESSQSSP